MRFIPAVSLVRFQSPPPIDDDYRRSGDSAFFYVREVPGRIMKRGPRNDIPFEYSIPRLKKEFETIGKSQGWWDIDSPIVLAVSGGSDSVAMLWMFAELWKGKLIIAHLEHGIRGSESRKDAIFVSEMAASFGLPLVSESRDVPGLLRKGESLEDGARRIRYKFLENTRASAGGWGIAVAHTSDDAAETFLHNLIRGSGVRGLTGIQEKRGFIFRPLLSFSRDFLRRMLNTYNIPWREDSTNTDTAYLRNRIRKSLLPFLESRFNPGVKEHILGTAADMTYYRQKEEMLQDSLFSAAERKVPFSSYSCGLDVIRKLGDAEMSVFFRGVGRKIGLRTLSRERTQSLVRLARSSGSWCFQWQRDMFVFCSSPFVSWVDPDILNRLDHSGACFPLEGERGKFAWNKWIFFWEKRETAFHSVGPVHAILPECGSVRVFALSDSNLREKFIAPSWGNDVFPALFIGDHEWVPFWGKQGRTGSQKKNTAAVHLRAAFPNLGGEKMNDHGIQSCRSSDS